MSSLDHWLYDQCLTMLPDAEDSSTPVLLVTGSKESLASDQVRRELLERFETLGARGIAFTTPFHESDAESNREPSSGWIIKPDKFYDPLISEGLLEYEFPDQNDQALFVGFSPSTDGIVRSQQMAFSDINGKGSSLEAAIADRWYHGNWSAPEEAFLIRFSDHEASLPTVSAGVVLTDGLVPELVRNRVVLIGLERDLSAPGVRGPIRASLPMTPLEVHGHAVNSLLTQTWSSVLSFWPTIALVVFGSAVVFFFYPRFPKLRRWLIAILLGAELVATWIALNFAHVWFSIGALWVAQICTAIACSARSRWHSTDLIERAVFHIGTRLRLRSITSEAGARGSSASAGLRFSTGSRSMENLSAELFHGLDSLSREMDLLDHLFNQAGTGIALYDEIGELTRINQNLRTFLSDRIQSSSLSSLGKVQDAVQQVLRSNTPVSFAVPVQERTAEVQVHVRPIEFNWSSSLAPIDSIDVLRTKFVICEWNLPHVDSPLGVVSEDRDLITSKLSMIHNGEDAKSATAPADQDFATVMTDFTETRSFRNPLQINHDQPDAVSPDLEEEFESVAEPVYE